MVGNKVHLQYRHVSTIHYLDISDLISDPDQIMYMSLLILCTTCYGAPLSATSKESDSWQLEDISTRFFKRLLRARSRVGPYSVNLKARGRLWVTADAERTDHATHDSVADSDSSQLLAKSRSTTSGIEEVEQTAPLRDGPAAWAWDS